MSNPQIPPNALRSSVSAKVAVAVLLGLAVACSWWPDLQKSADAQVDAGLKRALVTFAVARTLNALISVAQETDVMVQPGGLGVKLAPGQILDPVNDLVEYFSDLMLMASIAFGVQKVLLVLFGSEAVLYVLAAVAGIWLLLFAYDRAPSALTRLLVVLLVIRIGAPLALVVGGQIHQHVLRPDYEASTASIKAVAEGFERVQLEKAPETSPAASAPTSPSTDDEQAKGWWEKTKDAVKDSLNGATQWSKEKIGALRRNYDTQIAKLEAKIEDMVRLIAIFVVETLVLPIGLLWLLVRLIGAPMYWVGTSGRFAKGGSIGLRKAHSS